MAKVYPAIQRNKIYAEMFIALRNVREVFASVLKNRTMLLERVDCMQAPFFQYAEINGVNGTAVFIAESDVYKCYFRDLRIHREVYKLLDGFAGISVVRSDEFLWVRQEKFFPCGDSDIAALTCDGVFRLSGEVDAHVRNRSVVPALRDRMEQILAKLPEIASQDRKVLFLWRALEVIESMQPSELNVQHGDVWISNIMKRRSGELVLIDFDKLILMSKYYDVVYWVLMQCLARGYGLLDIADDADGLAAMMSREFALELPDPCRNELKYCIYAFVLLKGAERVVVTGDFDSSRLMHRVLGVESAA